MSCSGIYDTESFIADEIMVLQSIYEDKLEIAKDEKNCSTTLTIMLYPATADDASSQFVKLLLQLIVPHQYPDVLLDVNIKSSRGLSDDHLENLSSNLKKHVAESIGTSVIFDLIEMTKDSLTFNNIPSCPCPICLEMFQAFHDFVKTECFHYFHSYCMHEYVTFQKKLFRQSANSHGHHKPHPGSHNDELTHVPCPVCRKSVTFDMELIANSKKPVDSEPTVFDLTKVKQEVNELRKIYDRQKQVGGIIDLEAEKNKHLISSIEQSYASSSSAGTSVDLDGNDITESVSCQPVEETKKETTQQPTLTSFDKKVHNQFHRSGRYFRSHGHGGTNTEPRGKPLRNNANMPRDVTKNRFAFHGKQTLSEHHTPHTKPDRYNSSYKRMDRGRGKTLSTRHGGYESHQDHSVHKQSQKKLQSSFKTDSQPGTNARKQTNHNIKPPPGFT